MASEQRPKSRVVALALLLERMLDDPKIGVRRDRDNGCLGETRQRIRRVLALALDPVRHAGQVPPLCWEVDRRA